ncbi:MAG: chemotaxis response regulator protein-glutamate methylesterase [Thermotoga sp.]|nr:MAG: chemotaxis response regulator protein-glutamate methylesterase [Thermotoga sp.]
MLKKEIRVLIVDDSAFMRMVLRDIMNSEEDLKVVDMASDGYHAIEKVVKLRPDVVTLDVEMPRLNGLDALRLIMKKQPTPVIMLSSLTQEGADITIEALNRGAVDFIAKPSGSISTNIRRMKDIIIDKIRVASAVDVNKLLVSRPVKVVKKSPSRIIGMKKIVAIGTSTGGPKALDIVIPGIPANIAAPILVVQHMPPGFTASLANRLNKISNIRVKEGENGEKLISGVAYIAPGDKQMGIYEDRGNLMISVKMEERISGHRPSADYLFGSVADVAKEKVVAVIMTGMGRDGAKGCAKVKFYNGKVIAESRETCVVYGMPKAVVEDGNADHILPSYEIAKKINDLVNEV